MTNIVRLQIEVDMTACWERFERLSKWPVWLRHLTPLDWAVWYCTRPVKIRLLSEGIV